MWGDKDWDSSLSKAGVSFTHIHLNYSIVNFLSYKKKKKKNLVLKHYSKAIYQTIKTLKRFSIIALFCKSSKLKLSFLKQYQTSTY